MGISGQSSRSSLLIIFLVVFVDLVGFGIVIPILPYYAVQFGASAWTLGWLMAVYSIMQFFFAPLWGRLSDRIGRRPVLLFSMAGTIASLVILGLARSIEWLFVGRILAGLFAANISTAYAYVADVTTDKDRAKGMGLIGAGFGLGFIFGPAIGGVLSRYGYDFPMFFAAGLSALNIVFAFFKLAEPKLPPEVRAAHRFKRFDREANRQALSSPKSRLAILIFFLLTFAVTQMEVTFAIYMAARFNYNAQEAGLLLGLMGLIMASVQGGLIGKLARRFGELRLILTGTAICSFSLVGFALSSQVLFVVISLCILALGHGISHPSLSSLASKGAAAHLKGNTMGVFQSAGSLARVFGPPCAGWLYDHWGGHSPFLGGAVVLALAFSITLWKRDRAQGPELASSSMA